MECALAKEVQLRVGELIARGKRLGNPRDFTYRAIAEATGLSKNTVGKWARNDVEDFNKDVIAAFCEFFGCEPGELLVYEEVPERD